MDGLKESQIIMSKPAMENGRILVLRVVTGDNVCSFKNSKRSILDNRTGLQRTLTPKATKLRMNQLESAIVSALYSSCQMPGGETDLECLRQLRTVLSGLLDDSLKEIPEFSFGVRYVEPGAEGVEITIESLNQHTKETKEI